MKKEELKWEIKELSIDDKVKYYHRLCHPYFKHGKTKVFIDQYLNGRGNELKSKFWSSYSSSRLAFDLYSWLALEQNIYDFEFEYKLPGILSCGKESNPNMDVFYQKDNTVYFIESKFSETPTSILPEAYFKKADEYKNTSGKTVKDSIKNRFRKKQSVADKFSDFCNKYLPLIQNKNKNEWFDFKQEICHLFGIIFYGIECLSNPYIKRIDFKNIVYDFDDYSSLGPDHISERAIDFIEEATNLVNGIFREEKLDIKFEYGYDFIHNTIKKIPNTIKLFGSELLLKDFLEDKYLVK